MQLSWLLVVVGLLLCSELVAVVEGKKKHGNNNNLDRVWKNKRTQCEKFECGHLVVDENMNCVNNCTSALCFKVRDACVRCVVHSLTHLFPSFYHVLV